MNKFVYIAGYGRSGSTLLDMLLDSVPHAFGSGELARIFDQWQQNGVCSCQRPIQSCTFWRPVMHRYKLQMSDIPLEEAQRVTRKVEGMSNLGRLLTKRYSSDEITYKRVWLAMLKSIHELSGSNLMVDSSKSTRATVGRPLALSELCGSNLSVIHLVRDPRAIMWSTLRGSNRLLEKQVDATIRGGELRAMLSWTFTNIIVQLLQKIRFKNVIRVRYEDMVSNTQEVMERVGEFLHTDTSGVVNAAGDVDLQSGHGIAGNRLRRGKVQRLQLDEEWRSRLPSAAWLLAWIGWPLIRQYGYRLTSDTMVTTTVNRRNMK